MKVLIKEKEEDYDPDFPIGWKFQSKDSFKFPVTVGETPCFIKRFNYGPNNALVWGLLEKLKRKNEFNIPKVYDVVSVKEKSDQKWGEIRYVFYEFIEGATIDKVMERGETLNLERLTIDLFSAVESVHKHSYWFTDLCEKNVFCDKNGKFRLIDVDSCMPISEPPNNNLDVNMFYYALVFKFFRDILDIDIKPADIPGNLLNHFQIVFLILNLKTNTLGNTLDYTSDQVFDELPKLLNKTNPGFTALFRRLLESENRSPFSYEAQEIKEAIITGILQRGRSIEIKTNEKKSSLPERRIIQEIPVIQHFSASTDTVKKGLSFDLRWKVQDALKITLKRNGVAFSQVQKDQTSITITDTNAKNDETIRFTLLAVNDAGTAESDPVTITIYETIKVVEDRRNDLPKPVIPVWKRKTAWIISSVLCIAVISFAVVRMNRPARLASITDLAPKSVREDYSLIITGKNFEPDKTKISVLFNNINGVVNYSSETLIRVTVPKLGEKLGDGNVRVAIVVQKDTIFFPEPIIVKRKVTARNN